MQHRIHPNSQTRRTPCKRARKAAVTVEFAVSSGIVFVLFFAALEFCRAVSVRQAQELALYEGGRVGIVAGAKAADVHAEASRILTISGIRSSTITVSPDPITDETDSVSVRIRIPLGSNMFGPVNLFQGKVLDRTLVMKREGSN
jgi:hypothetical protein